MRMEESSICIIKYKMDNFDLKKYLAEGKLFEEETSPRGHRIQINGPYPEKFFSDDYIATLKNQKGEEATIFKHPNDGDYYVIVNIPYNKRDFSSFYYEIEVETIQDLEREFVKNEFLSPEENINNFIVDGELK
jgi:hypothetical protein